MSDRTAARHLREWNSKLMSIEFEYKSQPVVDGDKFLVGDTSDELADRSGL
jgi:hypothetical protein